ncbi:hypothetical protein HDU91_005862 [Kappamyces sp. JEL0680]|nr:hypothetical protein HDU91_005862 [Kappamyces sp. JEL0680]
MARPTNARTGFDTFWSTLTIMAVLSLLSLPITVFYVNTLFLDLTRFQKKMDPEFVGGETPSPHVDAPVLKKELSKGDILLDNAATNDDASPFAVDMPYDPATHGHAQGVTGLSLGETENTDAKFIKEMHDSNPILLELEQRQHGQALPFDVAHEEARESFSHEPNLIDYANNEVPSDQMAPEEHVQYGQAAANPYEVAYDHSESVIPQVYDQALPQDHESAPEPSHPVFEQYSAPIQEPAVLTLAAPEHAPDASEQAVVTPAPAPEPVSVVQHSAAETHTPAQVQRASTTAQEKARESATRSDSRNAPHNYSPAVYKPPAEAFQREEPKATVFDDWATLATRLRLPELESAGLRVTVEQVSTMDVVEAEHFGISRDAYFKLKRYFISKRKYA